jgi:outer membrane receptor protein involved in Fe transport
MGTAAILAAVAAPTVATLVPGVAMAQDFTTGSLTGTVTNTDGQAVAGATITLTQNGRNQSRTFVTDGEGRFRASQIPVGGYTVAVTAPGYEAYTDSNVAVALGGNADFQFTIGTEDQATNIDDVVVVGTRTAAVDFDRTTTGIVVDVQETFDRLPTARDLSAIQLLAPQATPGDPAFGNQVSIGGSSVAENVYYVNGMNITNFRNFLGGNTVPFEFYQQVDVKTGGFQAEYGRNTGGAVVAVTRSGGDEFHGGFNAYWTPDELRGSIPNIVNIDSTGGVVTADNGKDVRENRDANAWLSGPIWRDHAYFFGFYNWRDNFQSDTGGTGSREERTFDDPFFGGKLDFYLNPDQRLEVTYINDGQSNETRLFPAAGGDPSITNTETGGETLIYKYTGNFTDWLTISALYGENDFDQTVAGTADDEQSVIGFVGQGVLRGNPAQLIEAGIDERKLYRIDADLYLDNLFGSHHIRLGWDREDLFSVNATSFSGGLQYVYRGPQTTPQVGGLVPANTPYVRVRELVSGGAFETEQTAVYVQDAWDVNDRLSLQLGLRAENFDNKNLAGDTFVATDYEISPRLGVNYDLFGDRSTSLRAFAGRYYIPIAANTNIRMAGAELFTDDYYLYDTVGGLSRNADEIAAGNAGFGQLLLRCAADRSNACAPGLVGGPILENVNSDGSVADPSSLASANLEAQYQDEFIVGIAHVMDNGWRFGANITYRDLKKVMEDFDTSFIIDNYCASVGIAPADCGQINGSGYVLLNPGADLVITPDVSTFPFLAGQQITIPKEILDIPEAERTYQALELTFERPWDGKWALQGSAVFAKSEGNIEGGVKSDNGQDDTGLTQDFDEPGWTDGSFGLLPNHRGQTFKLFGSYALTDDITVGGNLFIQSPRKYGCIGSYPLGDGRANPSVITAWYCNGELTPRGSQFKGEWSKRVDVSLSWNLDVPIPGGIQLRADVFNIFDFQDATTFDETGDLAAGTPDPNYRNVTGYQAPRSVRLGFSYAF